MDSLRCRPLSVKVASVTVSFNDKFSLQKQIKALMAQSYVPSEIIIVDNASKDGTCDFIQAIFGKEVTLIPLLSNTGTAGGLKVGLEYAFQANHEWIWLLDQDSIPMPSALEELLKSRHYSQQNDSIGIMASMPVCKRTGTVIEGSTWRNQIKKIPSDLRTQSVYFADTVISSGSLVRRAVLEEVGYPNEAFFIDFVDHEYCLRIRRRGFRIVVIRGSIIQHAIGNSKNISRFGRGRVRFRHPPWREYYRLRNEIYIIWHQNSWKSKLTSLLIVFRRIAGVLVYDEQRIRRLKMILLGFWHGIRGVLGKRVMPQ